jgi:hypothetical protein
MLIGYNPPASPSAAVVGTGASIETDVLLHNGLPAEATRFRWLSAVSPAITDVLEIQQTWSTAVTLRAGALLGLQYLTAPGSPTSYGAAVSLPANVRIEITGKRSGDAGFTYSLGGNSLTQESVRLPDGSTSCPWVFDAGLTAVIGVSIKIYNDAAGQTWADADTYLDIGESPLRECVTVKGKPGWQERRIDPTLRERTLKSQLHKVARRTYREAKLSIVPTLLADVRGEGLEQDQDLQTIEAALSQGEPCIFIPHHLGEDGAFSAQELARTFLYGVAEPDPIHHVENSPASRRMYTAGYVVSELPPQ